MFVHITSAPLGMVIVAGSKEYLSFFSTIFTWTTLTAVADEVGVEADVEVAAVVGLGWVLLVCPPHAASTNVAAVAVSKRTIQKEKL